MAGTIAALFRLAGAGFVLAREGAFGLVDPHDLPAGAARRGALARLIERRGISAVDRGERLTAALNRLGPSYVKLGQFLATRPDLVGQDGAEALGKLRDEIAPFPEDAGARQRRTGAGQAGRRAVRVLLAAGRRRLDRPGPQGESRRRRTAAAARSPSRCCGPASAAASARPRHLLCRRRG